MSGKLETLLKEVKDIRSSMEKLENIIEQRLLGEEKPLEDEKQTIKEYEENQTKGRIELVSLRDAIKDIGVQRTHRKKSA